MAREQRLCAPHRVPHDAEGLIDLDGARQGEAPLVRRAAHVAVGMQRAGEITVARPDAFEVEAKPRLDAENVERVGHFTVNECPQPQLEASFGFRNLNPWNIIVRS